MTNPIDTQPAAGDNPPYREPSNRSPRRRALEIATLYAIVAAGWFFVTHQTLSLITRFAPEIGSKPIEFDAVEDVLFAVVSAVALFLLLRRDIRMQDEANEALRRANDDLELRVARRTAALADERAKLLNILDAMPDGVAIIRQPCVVEYANPAMQRQWGTPDGRSCSAYFTGRECPCQWCRTPLTVSGEALRWNWRAMTAQRTYEVVDTPLIGMDGEVATLEIHHDVTDRELAVREQVRLLDQIDAERKLFQAVIENAPAAIALFTGADFGLRWANREYYRKLSLHLVVATTPLTLGNGQMPSTPAVDFHEMFKHVRETGRPYVNPEFEYAASGRAPLYWQWSVLPLSTDNGIVPDLLLVAHDVTTQVYARKQIEDIGAVAARRADELRAATHEISTRAHELAGLLEISHTLSSTLSSHALLEVILDQLKLMITYDSAMLFVIVDQSIEVVAYRGELPQERVIGIRVPIEQALGFQEVAALGQVIIVDDLRSDGLLAQRILAAAAALYPKLAENTRSWMGAPLFSGDRLLGMLRLDHHEPGHFTASDGQLVRVIANHAAIAMENARLYEDARKLATLEERQRMARELHDSVSQALYGIALGAHAAREQLERAPEKLRDTLDYTLALSATAVSEMRALVFELRPDSLEQEGLVAGITRQIDAMRSRTGVDARLALGDEPLILLEAKEVLYRISQEALQNIAKHAEATTVCVSLRHDEGQILLEIVDNGIGFDPKGRFPGHLGLKTMHERATRLGGELEIVSEVGKGTRVRARLPVSATGREVVNANSQ